MKDQDVLKEAFQDVIWMAVRYAHGRHTYAPSMVRRAIDKFKTVYPDWELKKDSTIKPPTKEDTTMFSSYRSDYLDDLFDPL